MSYTLIDDQKTFENELSTLKKSRYLGIDTESDSLYSYYEKLCLLQICADGKIYLIDTLFVDIKSLKEVFEDDSIRKIFHSAESDIPLIKNLVDCRFGNIFDVMLAAKYAGIQRCGLNNLIEKYFSLSLNKKYQKADWGMRPLKQEMLEYAAMDVFYLKKLKDLLIEELKAKNLLEEFLNHCAALAGIEKKVYYFDTDGYMRIDGAKKLSPRELSVLMEIYLSREKVAAEADRPPFKILSNETMFHIASSPETALSDLRGFKGVSEYVFSKHSVWILEAVKKAITSVHLPKMERQKIDRPFVKFEKYRERFEHLRKWRLNMSKKRNLFPELILTNDFLWRIAHMERPTAEEFRKAGIDEYKVKLYAEDIAAFLVENHPSH